jgi:hypothetical protein
MFAIVTAVQYKFEILKVTNEAVPQNFVTAEDRTRQLACLRSEEHTSELQSRV